MKRFSIEGIYAILAISAIAFIFLLSCQLQVAPVRETEENPGPGGGNPVTRSIYAAGSVYMGNELYKPVLWVNGTPQLLPLPEGKTEGQAFDLKVSASKIYVAGQVKDAENTKYPCIWVVPIGSPSEAPILLPVPENHIGGDPSLTALFVENGNIHAAGELVDMFDPQNPQRKLAYWKNSTGPTFLPIPDPLPPNPSSPGYVGYGGMWVQEGTVYIAGVVNVDHDPDIYLPYLWKNSTPIPLSMPTGIDRGRLYGAYFSGGFLYLAGYYVDGTTAVPCYWKFDTGSLTSTIHALSGYTPNNVNFGFAPFAEGSTVYIGGGIGIPNQDGWTPTYWKNGTPVPVPLPSGQTGGLVTGITVKDGTVYVAGYYGDPEGIGSEGFIWKGSAKQAVSPPTGSQGTQIYALAVE